ncbi:hypothetical protein BHM03_00008470 [Ensete ventricosum]|nr:hypothetical protein BHM03_00008470 [Ensete ventricosum]
MFEELSACNEFLSPEVRTKVRNLVPYQHIDQLSVRFAISTFTARYIPVRQVAGTRIARYRAVPPATERFRQKSTVGDRLKGEIDCRRSIEGEIDRRRSIEREKWKKKKKRKKKKKKRKRIPIARARSSPVRRRCSRAVAARRSPAPARRRRPWIAGTFSPARGERSSRPRFALPDGKAPCRAVRTGPPTDRYADHPLPSGIAR